MTRVPLFGVLHSSISQHYSSLHAYKQGLVTFLHTMRCLFSQLVSWSVSAGRGLGQFCIVNGHRNASGVKLSRHDGKTQPSHHRTLAEIDWISIVAELYFVWLLAGRGYHFLYIFLSLFPTANRANQWHVALLSRFAGASPKKHRPKSPDMLGHAGRMCCSNVAGDIQDSQDSTNTVRV